MVATSLHRPIGFRPDEIAALVNNDVVAQHAEEVAFLWRLRRRAATEPHYALKDLAALDRRVEANLAGLRVAGDHGWTRCRAALERDGPGEVFALGVLAFAAGDRARMRDALYAGCAAPHLRAGLVSALGWLEHATVAPWLRQLLESKAPEHRAVAIAACAIHRHDPGPALAAALDAGDADLRRRALRAVGELKRRELIEPVRAHLGDAAPATRFWAAWALVLLGDLEGLARLVACVDETEPFTFAAVQLALRAMPPPQARAWIRALAGRANMLRLTVLATGIFGDPASMPWLIQTMEQPQLCRLAGEAFTSITGVDLAYHDLVRVDAQPLGEDAVAPPDPIFPPGYEANLQWPSAALVWAWWRANGARFGEGRRFIGGQPVSRIAGIGVMRIGRQRQRAAAALELACLDPHDAYFEVREVGDRQQRKLARWTS